MKLGTFRSTALMLAGSMLAATAVAQTAATQGGLNIPTNPQIRAGGSDPSIRKANAIVNGHVITGTDVDHRLALMIFSIQQGGGQVTPEEIGGLRQQVLRDLVDEALQIQAAESKKIKIEERLIEQNFAAFGQRFKMEPEAFSTYLRSIGSSEAAIKRQIRGELAWTTLQGQEIQPFVNISEDEVKGIIARLNASKGEQKYRIGEIFMSATPDRAAQVQANAGQLVEQLRKGAPFAAYARQFSEASTAAVGGDLGWVSVEDLPAALAQAAVTLPVGQVSNPIPVPGGYSVLVVQDTRKELMPDARDAALSLKQIRISFPKGATEQQAAPLLQRLVQATQDMGGCGRAEATAASIGAEIVTNDQYKVRDLPPKLQEMILALNIGQTTAPFGSIEDGVSVLTLCGRDDPEALEAPSYDAVERQLTTRQVDMRSQRYLRDLRRDAVIEYR